MKATRLGVLGASGRMGQAVVRLARELPGFEVVSALSEGDAIASLTAARPDVVIDFSRPAGTRALVDVAAGAGIAVVSGTTGLDEGTMRALDDASARVPIFWAPNMSVGVHVLGLLVDRAVRMLGPGFDVEIVEAHHRKKVDAPSGTAIRLAEVARAARGAGEIAVHSLRGGDVIGDHEVHLLGDGERLELTHRASNRDLFAQGALRAAAWIGAQPPGKYGMNDLLPEI